MFILKKKINDFNIGVLFTLCVNQFIHLSIATSESCMKYKDH